MLYNKGNHAQLKRVQPQPSPLQGENGGKIYSTWNPGHNKFHQNYCFHPPQSNLQVRLLQYLYDMSFYDTEE